MFSIIHIRICIGHGSIRYALLLYIYIHTYIHTIVLFYKGADDITVRQEQEQAEHTSQVVELLNQMGMGPLRPIFAAVEGLYK